MHKIDVFVDCKLAVAQGLLVQPSKFVVKPVLSDLLDFKNQFGEFSFGFFTLISRPRGGNGRVAKFKINTQFVSRHLGFNVHQGLFEHKFSKYGAVRFT